MRPSFLPLAALVAAALPSMQAANDAPNATLSAKGLAPFSPLTCEPFTELPQPLESQPTVFVNPAAQFQTFLGIGGALTDSSAEVFAKLPPASQEEFLKACWDPVQGIGYTFARTNIAACDFSSATYAYVSPGDTALKTFSVAHDETYRIPFIKKAIATAGGKLPLFVSPWSPPGWMKDSGNALQGGKLLPEFRDAWARHYVAFINAYEQHGIPIWGLTVQNEPMAKQTWESCIFTAEEERDFIRDHLGPTLAAAGMGDRKLIAWDHNRDLLFHRASTIMADPKAAAYVWGFGFHWYETWTGGDMQFDNLVRTAQAFPDKHLVFTEGCVEKYNASRLNDWSLGERYGRSLINDFNAGTVAWCDWNVLLDDKGGPNHVGNFCFPPIHADTATGKLLYTSSYYYLGHFSKYLKPGAKRMGVTTSRSQLLATGFLNPNGEKVVIVQNTADTPTEFLLWMSNKASKVSLPGHSIATFRLQ